MSQSDQNYDLEGVWTALVTPFDEREEIAWGDFENLVQKQVDAGVKGIVISGATGEAFTLSVQEKLSLIKKAKALVGNKIRVMAGSGSSSTQQSVELSQLCVEAGADSLLIVTPPYNKPSTRGLAAHFEKIAERVNVPLCLYHNPSRTNQKLTAEAIQTVCSVPKVTSVKEASADLALFSKARLLSPKGTHFLSGDDFTFLASLAVGGSGTISTASNVFPKAMVKIYNSYMSGDMKTACSVHDKLFLFFEALFCDTNPIPVKAILSHLQLCKNVLRLPLLPFAKEKEQELFRLTSETVSSLKTIGLV